MRTSCLLCLLTIGTVAGSGCSDASPGISVSIAGQFRRSNGANVDLAQANADAWDRVCVLAPHSDNTAVKQALGFDWDAEKKSAITSNDGIALLLFVRGQQVSAFAEHPRNLGDFAPLSGQCFPRAQARFQQAPEAKGKPAGLYPKQG